MIRLNRTLTLASCGFGSVALIGLGGFVYASTTASNNAEKVATQAVVLDQQSSFPWRMQELNSTDDLVVNDIPEFNAATPALPLHAMVSRLQHQPNFATKVVLTSADKSTWQAKGKKFIDQLFVPGTKTYSSEKSVLNNVLNTANGDIISIDGGVRNLHWTSVDTDVLHGTATLKGEGDNWASYAQWQPDKGRYVFASPHNIVEYTVTLQRVDGSWKVSDLAWTFAPGSEP